MRRIVILILTVGATLVAQAGDGHLALRARVGYNLGATTPLGMPASVSSIDAYRLTPSVAVGVDMAMPLGARWLLAAGLRFENKAMDADITAQGYHMELRRASESIEGLFTGKVSQQVSQWMLTAPVYAVYECSPRWRLKAGPYLSLLVGRDFSGIASDGYLRQGGPTGPKIAIGDTPGTWATYDFSDEMRRVQVGLMLGADWKPMQRIGFSLDVGIGLTGIFPSDFATVEQTLYPIYGTVGVFYAID